MLRPPPTAIVLAAGQGTRMRSDLPKVLHEVGGAPLLHHVLQAVLDAGVGRAVVVVGHGAAAVRASVRERFGGRFRFALQRSQRGTGHAVRCGLPRLGKVRGDVLLLYGDLPLVTPRTLRALVAARRARGADLVLASVVLDEPGAYGRVVRDARGRLAKVVEARDASRSELRLREVNAGIYAVAIPFLRRALGRLRPQNAQGEFYLTDLVSLAAALGGAYAVRVDDPAEVLGVNTPRDLRAARRAWRARLARAGVVLRGEVLVAPGARIGKGALLSGRER